MGKDTKKKKLVCPNCNKKVKPKKRRCPKCNYPLSEKARKEAKKFLKPGKISKKAFVEIPDKIETPIEKTDEPIEIVEKTVEVIAVEPIETIEEVADEVVETVGEVAAENSPKSEGEPEIEIKFDSKDDPELEIVSEFDENELIEDALESTPIIEAIEEADSASETLAGWRSATVGGCEHKIVSESDFIAKSEVVLEEDEPIEIEPEAPIVETIEKVESVSEGVIGWRSATVGGIESQIASDKEIVPEVETEDEIVSVSEFDPEPEIEPELRPEPESVAEFTLEPEPIEEAESEPALNDQIVAGWRSATAAGVGSAAVSSFAPAPIIGEPIVSEEHIAETEQVVETETVEDAAPIIEAEPIADADPIVEAEPIEDVDPLEIIEPVEYAAPIEDADPPAVFTPDPIVAAMELEPVVGEDLLPDGKPQGEPVAIPDPADIPEIVPEVAEQTLIEDAALPSQPVCEPVEDVAADPVQGGEQPGEEKSRTGWIVGLVVGCALCLLLGGVIGAAIQKNTDSQKLQEAEQKLEALEEQIKESDPGYGIYNIEQLEQYLNEEFGIDIEEGTILEDLTENLDSGKYGQVQDTGRKGRGKMGIEIANTKDGITIIHVDEDSAAAKVGIEKGDIIETVNGKKVAYSQDVVDITSKTDPGDKIIVGIKNKGDIEITLQ